jgi:hypothetical protein
MAELAGPSHAAPDARLRRVNRSRAEVRPTGLTITHSAAAGVLEGARLAHVGVETRTGPHVTPAAFGVADGRLWLVFSRNTLKVRAIRKRANVSILVRLDDRSVVVAGPAQVISPWGRDDIGALVKNYVPGLFASASYAGRNAELMWGILLDLMGSPTQVNAYDRVVVAVQPSRGLVIDGCSLVHRWGRWGRALQEPMFTRTKLVATQLALPPRRLPAPAAAAVGEGGPAAVGWMCPTGPVVLPGSPIGVDGGIEVPAIALQVVRAPARSPACVTLDRTKGSRPSRFAGVIFRGEGIVTGSHAGWARMGLRPDRVSWWSGFRAGTITAIEPRYAAVETKLTAGVMVGAKTRR